MLSPTYRGIVEQLQTSEHTLSLRKRVELLETLREVSCINRDRAAVDTIDDQIKHAVCEWIESLIVQLKSESKTAAEQAGKQRAA